MACIPVPTQYTEANNMCLPPRNAGPDVDMDDFTDPILGLPFTEFNRLILQCGPIQQCYNLFSMMLHFLNQMRAGGMPADFNGSQLDVASFRFIKNRCAQLINTEPELAQQELQQINPLYDMGWFFVAMNQAMSVMEIPRIKPLFKGFFLHNRHAFQIFEEQKENQRINARAVLVGADDADALEQELEYIDAMRLPEPLRVGDLVFSTPSFYMDPFGYWDMWQFSINFSNIPGIANIQHPILSTAKFISELRLNTMNEMSIVVTLDSFNVPPHFFTRVVDVLETLAQREPALRCEVVIVPNVAEFFENEATVTQFAYFMDLVNILNQETPLVLELHNCPLNILSFVSMNYIENVHSLRIINPINIVSFTTEPNFVPDARWQLRRLYISTDNENSATFNQIAGVISAWSNVVIETLAIRTSPPIRLNQRYFLIELDLIAVRIRARKLILEYPLTDTDFDQIVNYNLFSSINAMTLQIAPSALNSINTFLNNGVRRNIFIKLVEWDSNERQQTQITRVDRLIDAIRNLATRNPGLSYRLTVPNRDTGQYVNILNIAP
jgi:hypothetical protein